MAAVDPGGSGDDPFDPSKRRRLDWGGHYDGAKPLGGSVPSLQKMALTAIDEDTRDRPRRAQGHVRTGRYGAGMPLLTWENNMELYISPVPGLADQPLSLRG